MTTLIEIDRALADPHLLGAALGPPSSWATWLATLRAAFALPLSSDDRAIFQAVAGERNPPSQRVREFWAVAGRGSGKSRVAAALSVYCAAFTPLRLAPGEVGMVLTLAASAAQAKVVFRYCLGFLEASPILQREIAATTASEIRLRNGVVIAVHANSYRTVRGRTLLAVVFDEVSYWRDELSAMPDIESYRAVLPSLARTNGMLVGISTGYRKAGLLYQKWRDHFGIDGDDDVLVVQGPSTRFNPLLDRAVIERAKASDPESAEAEWEGGWRGDVGAFLDDATIDAAVDEGRPLELPPRTGLKYWSFADPSGGRHDAFGFCLAHEEQGRFIADVVRHRKPPFDPSDVVAEYAKLAKEYGVRTIRGDAYSANWCEAAFKRVGVTYERSELPKSQLYLETLPLWMRGVISIPAHAGLIRELRLLERRASRTGRDIVDHGRAGSDDLCNALCGAVHHIAARPIGDDLAWVDGGCDERSYRNWMRVAQWQLQTNPMLEMHARMTRWRL
jgi:hypothetical protein